jgi:signal transduction histidine kinase
MLAAWHNNDPLLLNPDHMLYLQLGVLTELFILNIALVYKVKAVQDDYNASQQQIIIELEENKKLALRLSHIREEISMDLHDEVGSGLSTIRLLTELIKIKPLSNENINPINKISESSKELVQKMNEIVWALNINNDNLEGLVAYIREYTMNFFDNTDIHCVFFEPENIPDWGIEGHSRRAIFLIVKEALNNIVKQHMQQKLKCALSFQQVLKFLFMIMVKDFNFRMQIFFTTVYKICKDELKLCVVLFNL